MASQPGNSDDLIAELARLMSSDAKSDKPEARPIARPAVTPQESRPQSNAGRAESARHPSAPAVRIPGMTEPPLSVAPDAAKLDFGAAPRVEPVSMQPIALPERAGARPSRDASPGASGVNPHANGNGAERSDHNEPPLQWLRSSGTRGSAEAASAPVPQAARSVRGGEPQVAAVPAVRPHAVEPAAGASVPLHATDFQFDFGLQARQHADADSSLNDPQQVAAILEPPAESLHAKAAGAAGAEGHDAIADLIAAELEAAHREQAQQQVQKEAQQAPRPGTTALPAPARQQVPPPASPQGRATPLAPGMGAKPGPDSDKFVTAPVFGLPGRPAGASAPPSEASEPELDPMDEIESLIGAAVRNESKPATRPAMAPEPAPARPVPVAPRSKATPTAIPAAPVAQPALRRAAVREAEPAPVSPDETIIAAANATGSSVGRIDGDLEDEVETPRERRRRERIEGDSGSGIMRRLAGLGVALALLVVAGAGLFWVLGTNQHQGPAPVLTADATPVKEPPPPVTPTPSEETRSQVMAQIDGAAQPANPGQEQLVSRDQSAGTDVASVASDNTEGGLANRKVRTVTVRPDGTIVSGEDSVAGAQALPVDRPNVPAVPGAAADATVAAPPPAPAAGQSADTQVAAANPDAVPSTPIELASDQVPGLSDNTSLTDAPAAPTAAPVATDAPVPMPRLTGRPTAPTTEVASAGAEAISPANAVVDPNGSNQAIDLMGNPAAAEPAQPAPQQASVQPPVATGVSSTNAGAYVQVSSQRSMADATASMNYILNRYSTLLEGTTPEIIKVDLGNKGTYYRVRVPTATVDEAGKICAQLKANGGDCFVTKG